MEINERGITLTSLIIYVTVMSVVIAAISTITTYSYKNMNNLEEEGQYAVELNKFDMYFLQDIKKAESISVSGNSITMTYEDEEKNNCNITYSKSGENIVRNNGETTINICKKVTTCKFAISGKNVEVILKINNSYLKDMTYIAENLEE